MVDFLSLVEFVLPIFQRKTKNAIVVNSKKNAFSYSRYQYRYPSARKSLQTL